MKTHVNVPATTKMSPNYSADFQRKKEAFDAVVHMQTGRKPSLEDISTIVAFRHAERQQAGLPRWEAKALLKKKPARKPKATAEKLVPPTATKPKQEALEKPPTPEDAEASRLLALAGL